MQLLPHQKELVDAVSESSLILGATGVGKSFVALGLQRKLGLRALVLTRASVVEQLQELFTDNALVLSYNKFIRKNHLENTVYPFITAERTILLADESSILKSASSKTSKTLMKMRPRFEYIFMFTACQAPNNVFEYFVPSVLTNGCFGESFYKFMHENALLRRGNEFLAYTHEAGRLFARGYKVMPIDEKDLLRKVSTFTHKINSEAVFKELPSQTFIKRYFDLAPKQRKVYDQILRDSVATFEDEDIPIMNKLIVAGKLQQVESGFFYDTQKTFELAHNKVACLQEIISELPDEQMVIFTQFVHERDMLIRTIPDSTRDLKLFQCRQRRFLIGHPASLGIGVNLQNARIVVFYSLSYSWELHMQSLGRIHRIGQKKPCMYYYILARDGVSSRILEVLQQKRDKSAIIDEILADARKLHSRKSPKLPSR